MAIKIEFMGYINKLREYDWGVVYDVAHNQQQKTDGQWRTVGRDYFSVVGPEGGPRFAENDLVTIKGTMKTKVFDKRDGSGKGIALNVRAEEMTKAGTQRDATRPEKKAPVEDVWAEAAEISFDNAPF